jgi:hypothetical protein
MVLWAHRSGFLVTSVLAGWGVYHLVLEEIDYDGRLPWLFLPLWGLSAYVLLPRLNPLLTGIYVPNYFIGRARTSDGPLGTRSTWRWSVPPRSCPPRWSGPARPPGIR